MAISSCEEARRLLDIFGISNIHLTKLQVELSVDEVVSVQLTITPTKEQYDKLCDVLADMNKPIFEIRALTPTPIDKALVRMGVLLDSKINWEAIPTNPEPIDTPNLVPHDM